MKRDIQEVLQRWGAWTVDDPDSITWPHIAAGFKGLIPSKIKSRDSCTDGDGLIISECIAKLMKNNQDLHDLLFDYYVLGMTFITLAKKHGCSDTHIGKKLQKAEGVIEGMLLMLDITLEMDSI